MDGKAFKTWLCAAIFAIVQMGADTIKAAYTEHYFQMVLEGMSMLFIAWLVFWAYPKFKRSFGNG